jgi:hypothetical protein
MVKRGIKVEAIICDGRKCLLQLFGHIPVQMCNFHQIAIVRRYLTKKAKLQTSKELWELTLLLKQTDKENFIGGLDAWHSKWTTFLNERKIDITERNRYGIDIRIKS